MHGVAKEMWKRAVEAPEEHEGEDWPVEWKLGLVVPLWKHIGNKKDKNTWRGITLLSVGSKLLARIVASRLQKWRERWLHESQAGFRRGRGVDDKLTVTRRVVEEMKRAGTCTGRNKARETKMSDERVLMSFFDIMKAYPRVCKGALWKLLRHKGCDPRMIKVCKALHEATRYSVKFLGGESSEWCPMRGLREGCPTSPPLFNVYHDAVMEDVRKQRQENAKRTGVEACIEWHYKIDGRLWKRARLWNIDESQQKESHQGKGSIAEIHKKL